MRYNPREPFWDFIRNSLPPEEEWDRSPLVDEEGGLIAWDPYALKRGLDEEDKE